MENLHVFFNDFLIKLLEWKWFVDGNAIIRCHAIQTFICQELGRTSEN